MQYIFYLPQAELEMNEIYEGDFYDFGTGFIVLEVIDFQHKSDNIMKLLKMTF
jgi:hypothetical protein